MIYEYVELPFDANGNYTKKLYELYLRGDIPDYSHVDVYHDPHCGFFKGKPCDCDPVVKWQEMKIL